MTDSPSRALHRTSNSKPIQLSLQELEQALFKRAWIKNIAGGGMVYEGVLLELSDFVDTWFRSIAFSYGAIEQSYPVLWPVSLMRKINYFGDFPQNPYLVTSVKGGESQKSSFATSYSREKDFTKVILSDELEDISLALGTSTCDTCYALLSNLKEVKMGVYTAKSRCFRNEANTSTYRLREFSMREIIGVGSQLKTENFRTQWLEQQKALLIDLGLEAGIYVSSDPFFKTEPQGKKDFQIQAETKYEVRYAPLENGEGLAIGSLNWHGDYFGRAFDIKGEGARHVHSTCWAFGIERLVLALLSQHGLEISEWPALLKRRFLEFRESRDRLMTLFPMQSYKSAKRATTGPLLNAVEETERSDISQRLHVLLNRHFGCSRELESFERETLPQWDSLNHLRLVKELETEFKITISDNLLIHLHSNAAKILDVLMDCSR